MNPMPQEVEDTLARHPRPFQYAKINEALYNWHVLAASKNIFPMGPQLVEKALIIIVKFSNMIIFYALSLCGRL